MPQDIKKSPFAAAPDAPALAQGAIITDAHPDELRHALDEACNYRGDVTIVTKAGTSIEGYLFDCRHGSTLETSSVRLIPTASTSLSGEEKVTVRYSEIASLTFSGKDTAAGKTWENWLKRYAEKKLKGEAASID
jgi:hypothetical protein